MAVNTVCANLRARLLKWRPDFPLNSERDERPGKARRRRTGPAGRPSEARRGYLVIEIPNYS